MISSTTMDDQLRQPYQGQLIKFTNVVKGWQARWFVLNPEMGTLRYYLSESDLPSRPRGSIQLAGAVISPSDEDCHTFTVSPASGDAYKLRALDTRDRQMWLNRLRVIAEMHTRAIAHVRHHPTYSSRDHRIQPSSSPSSLTITTAKNSSNTPGHLPLSGGQGGLYPYSTVGSGGGGGSITVGSAGIGSIRGLAVLDAFTQVSELLQSAHRQHASLAAAVEDLPAHGRGLKCSEPCLLLLKATSQATVLCLDSCLSVLKSQQQHLHTAQQPQQYSRNPSKVSSLSPLLGRSPRSLRRRTSLDASSFGLRRRSSPITPRQGSPSLRSSPPSARTRTAPHSPVPSLHSSQQQQLLQLQQQEAIHRGVLSQQKSVPPSNNQLQHQPLHQEDQDQPQHSPLKQTLSLNSQQTGKCSRTTTALQGCTLESKAQSVACMESCTSSNNGGCGENGAGCSYLKTTDSNTIASNLGCGEDGCDATAFPKFATVGEAQHCVREEDGYVAVDSNSDAVQQLQQDFCSDRQETLPTVPTHVLLRTGRVIGPPSSDSEESDTEENVSGSASENTEGDHNSELQEQQHSVIVHVISQLRLGMDLTKVTLPTFILERRSLLEMFADFIGHPDYFLKIADCRSSRARMLAVVRWYLTSVHVGRGGGSNARKPYNPIIGETFTCSWRVPREAVEGKSSDKQDKSLGSTAGSGGSSDYISVRFAAEQVSHHPPVSAFYFECLEKQICINAHIWTKSKFMGMSIGVNLIGDITLAVGGITDEEEGVKSVSGNSTALDNDGDCGGVGSISTGSVLKGTERDSLSCSTNDTLGTDVKPSITAPLDSTLKGASSSEPLSNSTSVSSNRSSSPCPPNTNSKTGSRKETYCLSMPSAYARNILTEPWTELGGRVNITCIESGCSAPIVFHTKPFYGGCQNRVTGEVKGAGGEIVCKVTGEWDGRLLLQHLTGTPQQTEEVLDVRTLPVRGRKRVRPIRTQGEGESRRLWQDVTSALIRQDLDTATAHKLRLEDMQRSYEAGRRARGELYQGGLFGRRGETATGGGMDHWVYKGLPTYASAVCGGAVGAVTGVDAAVGSVTGAL